jgi:prepilin-type N-terminal cleavage/methylation domain-containing protein
MAVEKGFTLVEIVIVIAIIGIASSIVLSVVSNGRTRAQVEGDARRLSGMLRDLQNNALAGEQIVLGRVSCGFSLPPSAAGAITIVPTYLYRNGATCATTLSDVLPTFSLSPGVSISAANGGGSFCCSLGTSMGRNGGSIIGRSCPIYFGEIRSGLVSMCLSRRAY